jgi:hypothetical protein
LFVAYLFLSIDHSIATALFSLEVPLATPVNISAPSLNN